MIKLKVKKKNQNERIPRITDVYTLESNFVDKTSNIFHVRWSIKFFVINTCARLKLEITTCDHVLKLPYFLTRDIFRTAKGPDFDKTYCFAIQIFFRISVIFHSEIQSKGGDRHAGLQYKN